MKGLALALAVGLPVAMAGAAETVVFQNTSDNGYFTPFNMSNATTVTYGDGGWLGLIGDGTPTFTCNRMVLGLATFGSDTPGSAELVFTFNDGTRAGWSSGPGRSSTRRRSPSTSPRRRSRAARRRTSISAFPCPRS